MVDAAELSLGLAMGVRPRRKRGSGKSKGLACTLVAEFRKRLDGVRHRAPLATRSRNGGRPRLREVQAAEARLDAGTFGLCEACGRPIALARLRASPTIRHCGRCRARKGAH